MPTEGMTRTLIRLPIDDRAEIKAIAAREGRPATSVMNAALRLLQLEKRLAFALSDEGRAQLVRESRRPDDEIAALRARIATARAEEGLVPPADAGPEPGSWRISA